MTLCWPSGSRLANPDMLAGHKVVQIDVDAEEIGRNYEDTIGLDGRRPAHAWKSCYRELSAAQEPRPSRQAEFEAARAERQRTLHRVEPQDSLTAVLRKVIPDDGIVVADMTQIAYYSRVHYPVYEPGTFMTSSYFGNLGYAFPTALGA